MVSVTHPKSATCLSQRYIAKAVSLLDGSSAPQEFDVVMPTYLASYTPNFTKQIQDAIGGKWLVFSVVPTGDAF